MVEKGRGYKILRPITITILDHEEYRLDPVYLIFSDFNLPRSIAVTCIQEPFKADEHM